jgi:hypothetical protein
MRGIGGFAIALLAVCAVAQGAEQPDYAFNYSYARNGLRVDVTAGEGESYSTGTCVISIISLTNAPQQIVASRDGVLRKVWVAELSGGPDPEIAIASQCVGSGSYGVVMVFARAGKPQYSQRSMPDLPEVLKKGYRGRDGFEVRNNVLYRIFPVYNENDTNIRPTGGVLRLRYAYARNAWVSE